MDLSILGIFAVILLLAFLVEALVEYIFGAACQHIEVLRPYSWALMYIALGVGVLSAFVYRLDLVSLIGEWLGSPIPVNWLGTALTGLSIGRGSNFMHDLIKRFASSREPGVIIGVMGDKPEQGS